MAIFLVVMEVMAILSEAMTVAVIFLEVEVVEVEVVGFSWWLRPCFQRSKSSYSTSVSKSRTTSVLESKPASVWKLHDQM